MHVLSLESSSLLFATLIMDTVAAHGTQRNFNVCISNSLPALEGIDSLSIRMDTRLSLLSLQALPTPAQDL